MQEAQQDPTGRICPCIHLHSPAPACTDDLVGQTTAADQLRRPATETDRQKCRDMSQGRYGEHVCRNRGEVAPWLWSICMVPPFSQSSHTVDLKKKPELVSYTECRICVAWFDASNRTASGLSDATGLGVMDTWALLCWCCLDTQWTATFKVHVQHCSSPSPPSGQHSSKKEGGLPPSLPLPFKTQP
jgi:hypothetical protein